MIGERLRDERRTGVQKPFLVVSVINARRDRIDRNPAAMPNTKDR